MNWMNKFKGNFKRYRHQKYTDIKNPVLREVKEQADIAARTFDGYIFHSLSEMRYYQYLLLKEEQGLIKDIFKQITFEIAVANRSVFEYTIDFLYFEVKSSRWIYDEHKPYFDPIATLRFKCFCAQIQSKIAQPRISWELKDKGFFNAINVTLKGKGRLYLADHQGLKHGNPVNVNKIIEKSRGK